MTTTKAIMLKREVDHNESGLPSGRNLKSEILSLINKARAAFRMPPLDGLPLGIPEKSRLCVLARALKVEILLDEEDRPFALVPQYRKALKLANEWRVSPPQEAWIGWSVSLPIALSDFVHAFDLRHHPELMLQRRCGGLRAELLAPRPHGLEVRTRVARLLTEGRELYSRSLAMCAESRKLSCRAESCFPVEPIEALSSPSGNVQSQPRAPLPSFKVRRFSAQERIRDHAAELPG